MVDQNLICLKHCMTGIMNVNEIRKLFRILGVSGGILIIIFVVTDWWENKMFLPSFHAALLYQILSHFVQHNWVAPCRQTKIPICQNTGCPRRNVPDFGRVFLMLKYTNITQNTCVQSGTVTEIMAREKCGLLAGPRTVPFGWQSYPFRPWL